MSVSGMREKLDSLREYLKARGSVAVAFSGGVDSSFLLKVAHDLLGDGAVAVTVGACVVPGRELDGAASFCAGEGIRQLSLTADLLAVPEFRANPKDRCYICKKRLFGQIVALARQNGITTVCEGSNADDCGDYRPGMKAIAELGVESPLLACGLHKDEIRTLSKELGLPTWDKPSLACLASRFPYGEEITEAGLGMVGGAEQLLHDMGFAQVRVRIHGGTLARIELEGRDMEAAFAKRGLILEGLRKLGFSYVALDLQGYRTGSMNEVI